MAAKRVLFSCQKNNYSNVSENLSSFQPYFSIKRCCKNLRVPVTLIETSQVIFMCQTPLSQPKLDFRCLHIHTDICSKFTIFIFCICLPCQTINDKNTSAGLCPLQLPNIILASTLRCAGLQSLHHRPCCNSFDKECVITEISCLSPEEMSMVTRSEAQNRFFSNVFFFLMLKKLTFKKERFALDYYLGARNAAVLGKIHENHFIFPSCPTCFNFYFRYSILNNPMLHHQTKDIC